MKTLAAVLVAVLAVGATVKARDLKQAPAATPPAPPALVDALTAFTNSLPPVPERSPEARAVCDHIYAFNTQLNADIAIALKSTLEGVLNTTGELLTPTPEPSLQNAGINALYGVLDAANISVPFSVIESIISAVSAVSSRFDNATCQPPIIDFDSLGTLITLLGRNGQSSLTLNRATVQTLLKLIPNIGLILDAIILVPSTSPSPAAATSAPAAPITAASTP